MMINEDAKILNTGTNKISSDFIKKPGKGWLHSDESIQEGITYTVKYIGFIGVKESMKSLSFDVRTQVARESIRRVAENAKCINLSRRNRASNDDQINRILSSACVTQWSGMSVQLHINTQVLKVTQLECNQTLFQHTMQNISFACGGDTDIQDYVAYVAKDDVNGRACYVFECGNNLANSVITTVGQAFELRFKKFLNSMPTMNPKKTTSSPTHSNVAEKLVKPPNVAVVQQSSNLAKPTPIQTQTSTQLKYGMANNNHNEQKQQDEKLEKMAWFHGLLTRENAEKLLTRDGDYLVRETNKAEKQYVLSGRYKGECRHIFLVDPSGVIRTKDRVFDNICHLIQYHQENKIPIISKENELLLEHPVYK